MQQWEYQTIDLIDLPKRTSLLDALNAAGGQGWELVAIALNNVAILKRPCSAKDSRDHAANHRLSQNARAPSR